MEFFSFRWLLRARIVNRFRSAAPAGMTNLRIDMTAFKAILAAFICLSAFAASPSWIAVDKGGNGFIESASGARFIPWGFNYSRDEKFRLIEDYWDADGSEGWAKVERDFQEMKRLSANVVRVHLQFGKFMDAPGKPSQSNLAQLDKLIGLAEDLGLYLDLTGLGTYRMTDVPSWYRNATEKERWAAQARFWSAVAQVCANRPSVFAYNLINEPLATASKRQAGEWTHPTEMNGLHYVEYINLDPAGRRPADIARAWLHEMTHAIRKYDQRHLITVGLVWVNNAKPEDAAGFPPKMMAPDVDFFAVHVYPERGKVKVALDSLTRYKIGKPIVVEETFPLNCSVIEFSEFIRSSRGIASGWLEHYWSQTPEDLKGATDVVSKLMLGSLTVFQTLNPNH
jgi:hypothetical protein